MVYTWYKKYIPIINELLLTLDFMSTKYDISPHSLIVIMYVCEQKQNTLRWLWTVGNSCMQRQLSTHTDHASGTTHLLKFLCYWQLAVHNQEMHLKICGSCHSPSCKLMGCILAHQSKSLLINPSTVHSKQWNIFGGYKRKWDILWSQLLYA